MAKFQHTPTKCNKHQYQHHHHGAFSCALVGVLCIIPTMATAKLASEAIDLGALGVLGYSRVVFFRQRLVTGA